MSGQGPPTGTHATGEPATGQAPARTPTREQPAPGEPAGRGERQPGAREADRPTADVRHVTDAQTIRALTHPVRLALLEALQFAGPLTATQAGELLGESPTTCSFHFRQLARYGFVTEAGGGKGRARPWRLAVVGNRVAPPEEDVEAHAAGLALGSLARNRALERLDEWERTASLWPAEWRSADDQSHYLLWVTREELTELLAGLAALLARFTGRIADPSTRPAGAQPVELLSFVHPVGPPPNPPSSPNPPARRERLHAGTEDADAHPAR